MWKVVVPDLPKVTQPLLYFRSSVDHVIDSSSGPTVLGSVSSRDVTERILEEDIAANRAIGRYGAELLSLDVDSGRLTRIAAGRITSAVYTDDGRVDLCDPGGLAAEPRGARQRPRSRS